MLLAVRTQAAVERDVDSPLRHVGTRDLTSQHALEIHRQIEGYLVKIVCVGNNEVLAKLYVVLLLFVHTAKIREKSHTRKRKKTKFSSPDMPALPLSRAYGPTCADHSFCELDRT